MTKSDEINYALAGLHEGGPLVSDELNVPTPIELDGERLIWSYKDHACKWRTVKPQPGMLEKFIRLADAPPESIRDFARRWGVLGICEHEMPTSHNPSFTMFWLSPNIPQSYILDRTAYHPDYMHKNPTLHCYPLGYSENILYDPIETWKHYAKQFGALRNIAANLHQDKRGRLEDWQGVYEWPLANDPTLNIPFWSREQIKGDRYHFGRCLNELLNIGGVRPHFMWDKNGPALKLSGSGLFGTLAIQLMLVVSKNRGLLICSNCSQPYVPSYKKNPNRRNFCDRPTCGKKAALRAAQASRRAKLSGPRI